MHIYAGKNKICTIEDRDGQDFYYYNHPDHLGSTSVLTDANGDLLEDVEYKPFGSPTKRYSRDSDHKTEYLFTGKELDEDGFYYYGARYYSPRLGRFISAAPTIARPYDSQDLNRYSYCRNNPLKYIDPSGLSWWSKLIGAIIGAIVGFVTGQPTLGMVVYSAIDASISAAQAGANVWQVALVAIVSAAAAYAGAKFGAGYGKAIGAGVWGTGLLAGMAGGAVGGATGAILTGGDVGMGALTGLAAGATAGAFSGFGIPGQVIGGTLAGGAGEAVRGGNFGRGILEGAVGSYAYAATGALLNGNVQANATNNRKIVKKGANVDKDQIRKIIGRTSEKRMQLAYYQGDEGAREMMWEIGKRVIGWFFTGETAIAYEIISPFIKQPNIRRYAKIS